MEQSVIKFIVETPEDDLRPVYITGSFNAWNPQDDQFLLNKVSDDTYEIELNKNLFPKNTIEYKFTRGGWENVELDQYGNICNNHKTRKKNNLVNNKIVKWRTNWGPFKKKYLPKIELISDEFEIPQLNKTRKVWALLPYNYKKCKTRYPVLYLQDAQNLFSESTAFGNWEIDKKLSILAEYGKGDVIIIAVEHGGKDRLKEYIFEENSVVEQGDGKKYIRFVTDTLKPYVDKHFRTKPEREHTGIGGSSLGGLISIYGGFLYPEVYSKLMIFSPSLWVFPQIQFPNIKFYNPFQTKIYIYGGAKEGAKMTERIHEFVEKMEDLDDMISSDLKFKISINPKGKHQEFYWSQEFPKAVEWLYFDSMEDPKEFAEQSHENNKENE